MNRQTLPISEIQIPERMRKDLGDLTLLRDSIKHYGLIQPVVVDQNKTLVAGGRRIQCHIDLKLPTIDVVYRESQSEPERLECEAIENIVRKDFTWQEECLAVLKIHRSRTREAVLTDGEWNTRIAAQLFGYSKGTLNYVLTIAKKLEEELTKPEKDRRYHSFESCAEAYRLGFLKEQEDNALALLAKRHQELAVRIPTQAVVGELAEVVETKAIESTPGGLDDAKERYYANPHNAAGSFEAYWASRQKKVELAEQTIYVSARLYHGDCIDHMLEMDRIYDHIITDIPYGIDMENLNQVNQHGGFRDLEQVEKEHDVKENEDLMARFFPAAFKCTKESAFVITYCDVMQWQYMYDLAIKAGFNVQRWPIIWHKPEAMNNCAQYNSTKNYEIIMVCRKPSSTLRSPLSSSIIHASAEQAKRDCSHPFSKPYEITRILADAISVKGSVILDPFAGGGSIVLELLRQERNAFGCEKKVEHYNNLLNNVKNFYLALNPKTIFK